jgi:hypothetical protein
VENETHAFMKTRVFAILLGVVLGLCCCKARTDETDIINREKMMQIMGEVYLVEMHYQKFYGTPSRYKLPMDSALTTVFKKHRVSRRQYENSFTHYASNPAGFMEMNEQIIQQYNETLVQK